MPADELNSIEKAVLKTLAYFDLSDYPLTEREAWQWLHGSQTTSKIPFSEVTAALGNLLVKTRVSSARGFYFLPGREATVSTRLERYQLAERKFRRFCRVSKLLALIPFVRLVASCNTLAYSNSRDAGDLDVFLITKAGHIWTTRLIGAGLMQLLGLRPKPGQEQDKVCLSFAVTENSLDVKNLAIDDDIYLRYWLNQLIPVYMEEKYYIKLVQENMWLRQHLPNFTAYRLNERRRVKLGYVAKDFKTGIEKILSRRFGAWLERQAKNYQMNKMPDGLKKLANKSTAVVVNDNVLKFHDQDRRQLFRDQYFARLKTLGLEN